MEKGLSDGHPGNFAETAVEGRDEHTKRDVDPHKKDRVYIDPPDRFAPLKDRIFNEREIVAADWRRCRWQCCVPCRRATRSWTR